MAGKRRRLVECRKAIGLSQEGLAEAVGVDRSTAARWERGETTPQPWHRLRLADALDVTIEEVKELLGNNSEPETSVGEATGNRAGTLPMAEFLVRQHESGPGMLARGIDQCNATTHTERLLLHFLALEAELGGDRLYASLAAHVEGLAPTVDQSARSSLVSAFGQLCQLAGWLALDANRHQLARQYLCMSVLAGHQADEPALAANALAYMSLQEIYRDHPERALALAKTAQDVAAGSGTPYTNAILSTRLARAHAKTGHRQESLAAIGLAEEAFASGDNDSEPLWLSYVDQREITAQKGACYLDLGMHRQAATILTEALRLLDQQTPTRVRDRVHYLSRLAKCYLFDRDLDRACATAHEALDVGWTLGSARVVERIAEFHAAVAPHAGYREVRVFRDRFSTFAQRR